MIQGIGNVDHIALLVYGRTINSSRNITSRLLLALWRRPQSCWANVEREFEGYLKCGHHEYGLTFRTDDQ
jgi:hypothetical protein